MNLPRKSECGKVKGFLILVIVVGGLFLLGATVAGRASGSDEPTCDGDQMRPGDSCISFGRGGQGGTYDEMKRRVPGNQRANRVASIVIFSVGGLVLVGGLLFLRASRQEARTRSAALQGATVTEAAAVLAAGDELGALMEATRDDSTFRKGRGQHEHHRYERGLVTDTEKGPLSFPYRDVRIYREHAPNLSRQGDLTTWWRFERTDRPTWQTAQSNNAPLGQLFERVLVDACAHQRGAALQALAEGARLSFGPVELDLVEVTFGGQAVAWADVTGLSIDKGVTMMVETAREGRFVKKLLFKVAKIGEVPNFPLLWDLAHVAHANASGAAEGR